MADLQVDLQGIAKKVFDTKVKEIVPPANRFPGISRHPMRVKLGSEFSSTILDKLPGGFTFGDDTETTLNAALPAKTFELTDDTHFLYLRDKLAMGAISRAKKKGPLAYANLMMEYGSWLKMSHYNRLELNMMLGGYRLGYFPNDANTRITGSSVAGVAQITKKSFVPDAYQMGNAYMDLFRVDSGTYTLLNTFAPIVVTGSSLGSGADVEINFTCDNGDFTTINNAADGTTANRHFEFWFHGARTNSALVETPGLANVASVAAGDSYLNYTIPSGSLQVGTSVDVGDVLSFTAIEDNLLPALTRGARATDANPWLVYFSYHALRSLASELRSASTHFRQVNKGGEKVKVGNTRFVMDSAAGPIEFIPTYSVPLGEAYAQIYDPSTIFRIGSAECVPAYDKMGGNAWTPLEDSTAIQTLQYSDVGLRVVKLANVVALRDLTI